jgi:hypothetical protein
MHATYHVQNDKAHDQERCLWTERGAGAEDEDLKFGNLNRSTEMGQLVVLLLGGWRDIIQVDKLDFVGDSFGRS